LYRDADKNGSYLAKKAFRLLWPTPADRGYLIVLIGRWGSLIVDQYEKVERIRAVKLPKKQGRNWLGCGDLFRAEFIHRVLIGASCEDAAKAATQAVAEKIPKMSFFLE
jgi:sugar/nucleoside kinase (ribokinase family)